MQAVGAPVTNWHSSIYTLIIIWKLPFGKSPLGNFSYDDFKKMLKNLYFDFFLQFCFSFQKFFLILQATLEVLRFRDTDRRVLPPHKGKRQPTPSRVRRNQKWNCQTRRQRAGNEGHDILKRRLHAFCLWHLEILQNDQMMLSGTKQRQMSSGCVYTLLFRENYIHIGVGFSVARSTTSGNARASKCGMSSRRVPALSFYAVSEEITR